MDCSAVSHTHCADSEKPSLSFGMVVSKVKLVFTISLIKPSSSLYMPTISSGSPPIVLEGLYIMGCELWYSVRNHAPVTVRRVLIMGKRTVESPHSNPFL